MLGRHATAVNLPGLALQSKIRTLFVTQSPVLAAKAKASYLSIIKSFDFENMSDEEAIQRGLARIAAAQKVEEDLEDLEDEGNSL